MTEIYIEEPIVRFKISGMDFDFIADTEFCKKLTSLADEASYKRRFGTVHGGNIDDAIGFLTHIIDTLIGEGTVESIYGGESPDPYALLDIINNISDAFHTYVKRRIRVIKEGMK